MMRLVVFLPTIAALSAEQGANPIRRIVTLLQDMKKEIEADGAKEEELYKNFKCYCKTNDGKLEKAAEEAKATIERETAAADDKTGRKEQLIIELKDHKKDRADATKSLEEATEIRQSEKAVYDEKAGETGTYIDGTKAALKALSRGKAGKMPRNPDDFLQTAQASTLKNLVGISKLDSADQQTMLDFLQGDYHTVGGEIIGILDNMLDEFKKSLGTLSDNEEAAIKAYLTQKASLEKVIAASTKSIEEKSELKGQLAVEAVEHRATAEAATKELSDAQEFLVNLKISCQDKDKDWEARSAARADELSAIQDAITVLNDDDALDIFKSAVDKPALIQASPRSFLQTRQLTSRNVKDRAMSMLSSLKTTNKAVSLLAHTAVQKLKANSKVDFSQIIVMIDDMIKTLKADQAHDESTQDRCNTDLTQNEADQKDTNNAIASAEAVIEAAEAAIEEHNARIADKETEVKDLDKAAKEATEQRAEEHSEYQATIALNNSAIQLIEKAINKLNRFYNPGQYKAPEERELTEEERLLKGAGQDIGDTTAQTTIAGTSQTTTLSFLQISAPEQPVEPETYGEHKAKHQKSSSVISLLRLMQNDLKKESQAAEHAEKTAQRDYETLMADTAATREACVNEIGERTASVAEQEAAKGEGKDKFTAQSTLLMELKEQKSNLHAECDFILAHFEERLEARNTEIDGLTTAKSVLSGANFQ